MGGSLHGAQGGVVKKRKGMREDPEHQGCTGPGTRSNHLFNLHHKPHQVAMMPILQKKLIPGTR